MWSSSKDQNQVQIPRKKEKYTYEVRVEGRNKEGSISFAN
jgi:hypothetical protein